MKKFLTATLAATLLFPSPILANDDMPLEMDSSADEEVETLSDFNEEEYETEMMLSDEEIINESSSASNSCTITFEGASKTADISFKDGVISPIELIKRIPDGYHFKEDPKEIKKADCKLDNSNYTYSIKVEKTNANQLQFVVSNLEAPCAFNYSTNVDDDEPYWLEFNSWKSVGSSTEITAANLNKKLKDIDSTIPYTIKNPIKFGDNDLKYVYSLSSTGALQVCGYLFTSPRSLEKVDKPNLSNRKITVQIGNQVCELKAGDFKENNSTTPAIDAEGKITVNTSTLTNALNAMPAQTRNNCTFEVTGSISPNTLDAYKTGTTTLTVTKINIIPSASSYVGITFLGSGGTLGTTYVTLGSLDKDNAKDAGYGKVSYKEMENYLNSYSKDLLLAGANPNQIDLLDFTKFDFPTNNGYFPEKTVNVVPAVTSSNLYNTSFTISFVDSETGKLVEDDSRVWSKFFKTNPAQDELNKLNMTNILPDGYGIALLQVPNSTAQTKKKLTSLANQGDFAVSILGPKKATVYVTKLEGYKEPTGGGHIARPEEPVKPNAPQLPVEQPQQPTIIPSQGHQVMYRLFNSKTGEHFYTRDAGEKSHLLAQDGWSDEGQGWTAPAISSYPVYRVFNPNSGEHHYTKDKNEYETLVRLGWNGEGHAFFSADDANNKVTLYRLYNNFAPEVAKHHYTSSKEERDKLIKEGWNDEGTAWFGMPLN